MVIIQKNLKNRERSKGERQEVGKGRKGNHIVDFLKSTEQTISFF